MIFGFGFFFCWDASHSVLLWSSFSVQSADKHSQANSSAEKVQISPSIRNLNGGQTKQAAGIALCTCRKQLILIPPRLGGSCLDRCEQRRETKDKQDNLKRCSWDLWLLWLLWLFLLLWCRTVLSLTARIACSLSHNKEHKTEMEWEQVISYCARPYALTSPFSSDDLSFYEVQNLWGWHFSFILPA